MRRFRIEMARRDLSRTKEALRVFDASTHEREHIFRTNIDAYAAALHNARTPVQLALRADMTGDTSIDYGDWVKLNISDIRNIIRHNEQR